MKQALVFVIILCSCYTSMAQTVPHYFVRVYDNDLVSGGQYLFKGEKLLRPDTYRDIIDMEMLTKSLVDDVGDGKLLVYIHGFSAGDIWYERYMARQLREAVTTTTSGYSAILNVMYDTHSVYGQEKKKLGAKAHVLAPVVAQLLTSAGADISMLAHSMGNRVALDFIKDWSRSEYEISIDHLLLAAPDLPIDSFKLHRQAVSAIADTIVIYRHDTDRVLGYARSTDDLDRLGLNLPQTWDWWPSNAIMLDGSRIKGQKTLYDNMSNHRYHLMSQAGVKSLRYLLGLDYNMPCSYTQVAGQPRYIICQD